jgi:hypothetical protein
LWEYRPDFNQPVWRRGATTVASIREEEGGLVPEQGTTGTVVWTMENPYVFVGGRVEFEGTGARFQLAWDGDSWHDVEGNLDGFFAPQGPARYKYFLKCTLSAGARLASLAIVNDLQMAPLTLPGMGVGSNTFTYTDETASDHRVRITHRWVERSASRSPEVPPEPIRPADGGTTDGTDLVFEWRPPSDPDGDAIADYHFELSARADMNWPLSMSFAKLASRTPDAGHARYTLPGPGLLNPDTEYFWRVRAMDAKGVWGPWSRTWSFTPRGPGTPLDLSLDFDPGKNRGVLRWRPNPKGARPVSYRVYASDEKGFSVSDRPYQVSVGISDQLPAEFPANFLTETSAGELEVVGPDVDLPGANNAFYRVVAADAAGRRSGPSDYAAAPRPLVLTRPVIHATQGMEYRYRVAAIRSLGDLRMRVVAGKETTGFWDIERPRFAIQQGPRWLTIDAASGLLSGTPDGAGPAEVVVAVTLERDLRRLDEAALKWGIEKVVSTGTETVGTATQRFVIEVDP